MSERYWWDAPWTLISTGRALRFLPQSLWDFSSAEAVNRWSLYALYVGVAGYLILGTTGGFLYAAAIWAGLYLWNVNRRPTPAVPSGVKAGSMAHDPTRPPPKASEVVPTRNVATYAERLETGLTARGAEVPARVPLVASKQRKVFARQMPMTGDEVPYKQIYEQDRGAAWRPRPVG